MAVGIAATALLAPAARSIGRSCVPLLEAAAANNKQD